MIQDSLKMHPRHKWQLYRVHTLLKRRSLFTFNYVCAHKLMVNVYMYNVYIHMYIPLQSHKSSRPYMNLSEVNFVHLIRTDPLSAAEYSYYVSGAHRYKKHAWPLCIACCALVTNVFWPSSVTASA